MSTAVVFSILIHRFIVDILRKSKTLIPTCDLSLFVFFFGFYWWWRWLAGHLRINPTTATKPIAWEDVPTVEPRRLQNSLLCANQSVWLIARGRWPRPTCCQSAVSSVQPPNVVLWLASLCSHNLDKMNSQYANMWKTPNLAFPPTNSHVFKRVSGVVCWLVVDLPP